MRDILLKLKNKDFAFRCIKLLQQSNRKHDIEMLTDADFCKRKFDMNYAILNEVAAFGSVDRNVYLDTAGNRRYYPEIIELFGHRYILCNDWYYNCKSNVRDTRTDFVNWVLAEQTKA